MTAVKAPEPPTIEEIFAKRRERWAPPGMYWLHDGFACFECYEHRAPPVLFDQFGLFAKFGVSLSAKRYDQMVAGIEKSLRWIGLNWQFPQQS